MLTEFTLPKSIIHGTLQSFLAGHGLIKKSDLPAVMEKLREAAMGAGPDEAIEQAERIEQRCEELPAAGDDFGQSVIYKCREIAENIAAHDRVTPGQQEALDNMEAGVRTWFHD